MDKARRIILLALTLLPIPYLFLLIYFFFSSVAGDTIGIMGFNTFSVLLYILLIWGLLFIYIADIFRNERILGRKKILWAIVIFFTGIFGMLAYWYLYFWKEK